MDIKNINKKIEVEPYNPTGDEKEIQEYVEKRKQEMQNFRRGLGLEKEWREADIEYVPHELEFGTPRKRFETDQDTGLRSRMVPIGDQTQQWRSNIAAPTLLVKIQTAFSIMIDQNPEAMLTALERKFENTTQLAYSLWKRNWAITDAKEKLKLIVFDMLKYGWGIGRTYPRKISYKKEVLTEFDSENPENNKYETKQITWFNDVYRERLSPYKTWIDEKTKPYDPYSTNDCYFEIDFSYEEGEVEFGNYPNWKLVKPDSKVVYEKEAKPATPEKEAELMNRSDIVTIGFYENRAKDLFVIWIPKDKIILHTCPLPNDDGMLSTWHAPWILRSADSPYGISVWKIIKQDKQLYDKMMNMTSDQLVLSIMKFGFHTGTSGVLGDGVINVVPGQSKQITNGKFDWMEIPGPGKDAWDGLEWKQSQMDSNSGITPTIEGDLTGKTLGEIQLAREASLKRLKVPLENIAWAIEQDAYLTLSWMNQVYSTPEVKEFANLDEITAYEQESGIQHNEVFAQNNPQTGEQTGLTATFLPELSLHLEDRDGKLYESEQSRFFQIGKDLPITSLRWKGIFKIIPRSILGTSETILKQTKTEMANMLIPLLTQPPELVKKTAMQLLKINEEDPIDWLPESWLQPPAPKEPEPPKPPSESINFKDLPPEGKVQMAAKAGIIITQADAEAMSEMPVTGKQSLFLPKNNTQTQQEKGTQVIGEHTMQNRTGMTARQAPKAVPGGQVSSTGIATPTSGLGKLFSSFR